MQTRMPATTSARPYSQGQRYVIYPSLRWLLQPAAKTFGSAPRVLLSRYFVSRQSEHSIITTMLDESIVHMTPFVVEQWVLTQGARR
jgi:hypothetical protein